MTPPDPATIRAEADRLSRHFANAGALSVDTTVLQPAETLLDLYGEDIRARAYVTHDPEAGEMMLRPDFTVPVVQMHMNRQVEPARYTYQGSVWRMPDAGSGRVAETLQVGFEVFDRGDPGASDAEVFALVASALQGLNLRAATGDLGVLIAAVNGLGTLESRKSALSRHLWRPERFRQLLERYGDRTPVPQSRERLLANASAASAKEMIRAAGTIVGLRSEAEIAARIDALQSDAVARPVSAEEIELLERILSVREMSPVALGKLRLIATHMPSIRAALDRMETRLEALLKQGVDVDTLEFEGSYGRTTLEYYDGFVFGFYAEDDADLPVVALGGRYDALTEVLGAGGSIPAVGGVVRPEFVLALSEGTT